jgi:hypothetical protein
MAYYPKSQVKTSLYTPGNEYALSTTGENYIGYYYETSTGQAFSGKNPQQGLNIPLVIFTPSPSNSPQFDGPSTQITSLNSTISPSLPTRFLPPPNPTLPTDQDKQKGQFTRYFCKKTNELVYIEISKTTFTQLSTKSPDIAWDLYDPISLLWQIEGNKEQVYKSNKISVQLIEQRNKWYGFSQYFKDKYLKYYLGS